MTDKNRFHGQNVVVLGGGDSALDWAIELYETAASITLVHRREAFRAAPASVDKLKQLAVSSPKRMRYLVGRVVKFGEQDGLSSSLTITAYDSEAQTTVSLDELLVFDGLSPNLGPIRGAGFGDRQTADSGRYREVSDEY